MLRATLDRVSVQHEAPAWPRQRLGHPSPLAERGRSDRIAIMGAMDRIFWVCGTVTAGLAVAFGAFGAHAVRAALTPDRLATFETAARYHFFHALAILLVALALTRWPRRSIEAAGWLFLAGIVVFSGSLYLLSLTDARWLGAITPIGGAAFLGGWACLAWAGRSVKVASKDN